MALVRRKPNKIKEGSVVVDIILLVIALILCIITLYPFYFVIIMSISSPSEVAAMNVFWFPKGFNLSSYEVIVKDLKMWWAYSNTLIYVGVGTILNCLMAVLGAYPLTVRNLKGRKWVVAFLLIPMYFGGGLIPSFLLVNKLGLYNTMLAIIIPGMVSIWNIILVRTFFTTIPDGLKESAFIDGASHLQLLFRIIIPISKPILAVIAIYSIVGIWNSWFDALVYLPNEKLHPLQMYLYRVIVQQSVDLKMLSMEDTKNAVATMLSNIQLKYTIIVFTTLPVIFTYPFFQKYFIKGALLGSLKE
ncbi:carbohydrate ABC transporter permease [Yersinia pestis]|uniref:carbohydrate ABC transporter permease n=1 Tax=Paenibacillus lautus TaxID=1401 RepID=UPI0025606199|nr:carbohydrate ABC transporter permease [Paenibacillus lautus]MDL1160047.1 carbohydrate ABC transporter permease [Yersinia pestis]MEC0253885.1 carbohydrate ABC transporter permease [Paenibacillus lautus]